MDAQDFRIRKQYLKIKCIPNITKIDLCIDLQIHIVYISVADPQIFKGGGAYKYDE
jgi:hypothetical protein